MEKKDNGVYNYMDCSTEHITPEDNDFLESIKDGSSPDLIIDEHPYGYWMHVGDEQMIEHLVSESSKLSTPLKAIFQKAKKENCNWIKLDQDGFEHDDLEKYDW